MTDYSELEAAALAATPGIWVARADGWTIRAYPDARMACDGVKVVHTCSAHMQGQGSQPDIGQQVANQHYIELAQPAVVLALIAENKALRDDLEQTQYDATAWRNGEESVWIEAFNSEGDDPFICAISGQITVEQLALIQAEILEYRDDYFEKGSGLYVFRCAHYQAHHDNVGMTEPAHWETDFESFSLFPWEEERAAMSAGDQP